MTNKIKNPIPEIPPEDLKYFSWNNEICNLRYLMDKSKNKNSKLFRSWENRLKELQSLFIKTFHKEFISKKVIKMPRTWVLREYQALKKLM